MGLDLIIRAVFCALCFYARCTRMVHQMVQKINCIWQSSEVTNILSLKLSQHYLGGSRISDIQVVAYGSGMVHQMAKKIICIWQSSEVTNILSLKLSEHYLDGNRISDVQVVAYGSGIYRSVIPGLLCRSLLLNSEVDGKLQDLRPLFIVNTPTGSVVGPLISHVTTISFNHRSQYSTNSVEPLL